MVSGPTHGALSCVAPCALFFLVSNNAHEIRSFLCLIIFSNCKITNYEKYRSLHLWLLKIICYPVLRNIAIWGGTWGILHTGHCGFLTSARLSFVVLPDTEWTSLSVQRQRDSKMPAIIFNNWGIEWANPSLVSFKDGGPPGSPHTVSSGNKP